jgi:hypothetical protein
MRLSGVDVMFRSMIGSDMLVLTERRISQRWIVIHGGIILGKRGVDGLVGDFWFFVESSVKIIGDPLALWSRARYRCNSRGRVLMLLIIRHVILAGHPFQSLLILLPFLANQPLGFPRFWV